MDDLEMHLGALPRLSNAKTRSISPENFTGASGSGGMAKEGTGAHPARDLGQGWKISPSVMIAPNETYLLADIAGPAAIQHFWITNLTNVRARDLILRIYWDNQENPSVEVPLGDFFVAAGKNSRKFLHWPFVSIRGVGLTVIGLCHFMSVQLSRLKTGV